MQINRYAAGAVVVAGALLIGGGVAVAGPGDGDQGGRCEQRLERIAEERGVSVEQLQADVKARLLARIDAAEKAGKLSSERAAKLRARVSAGHLCQGARHAHKRITVSGMLRAAAEFLELDREELREQLAGASLGSLATKQGKSVDALEAAMVAPAKERLAKAVASGRISQARADVLGAKLEMLAERLAAYPFRTT
jgi:hypothetical protein